MKTAEICAAVQNGETALGIEFGSTRIKAVLINKEHQVLAQGSFDWENQLTDGVWSYPLSLVWEGLRGAYGEVKQAVQRDYGVTLKTVGSIGISAMMHGYLPFDRNGEQLVPFRTWRNTVTEQAAEKLTALFHFNIPQRWSVAHLYQAILNGESHVQSIAFLTTLAGYVHWQLTGEKVVGVGEAAGMFPVDSRKNCYDEKMVKAFESLPIVKDLPWELTDILPKILSAGECAGTLTETGAHLLDPSGDLASGIPFCPPEGDAGTGMVATNSVAPHTGNVSAGTSIFAMAVLEKPLSAVYTEIDMVATPTGKPVAMVHCNTCTSDLDAWVKLFSEMLEKAGAKLPKSALYDMLYGQALQGDADCGGLVGFNYYSGEPVTDTAEGRPLFIRMPDANFTLANFMRNQIFSAMATLRLGMDILFRTENVRLQRLLGHGGLFKTPLVGQKLMAGALNVPVSVMETAGEGGAWGIALLAAFLQNKADGETLEAYLENKVFGGNKGTTVTPDKTDVDGFNQYMTRYKAGLAVERAAVENL